MKSLRLNADGFRLRISDFGFRNERQPQRGDGGKRDSVALRSVGRDTKKKEKQEKPLCLCASVAFLRNPQSAIRNRKLLVAILCISVFALIGCYRDDMRNQPKYKPLDESAFFPDGRAARPQIAGTVARGQLRIDDHLYTGRVNNEFAEAFPFRVSLDVLKRGQERYNIFCSPCHDRVGTGEGMIVQRGFRRPSSFHIERLRESPPGYFFDVITNGFGTMYSYADRVKPEDRWAIVAYIRALQLSQQATLADVPADEVHRLSE